MSDAPRGAWQDGHVLVTSAAEGERARRFGWSLLLGVLALLVALDLVLATLPPLDAREPTRAQLRERLAAAAAVEGRSLVIVGDRGLTSELFHAEMSSDAGLSLHAIDLARVTPSDALALLAELDRVDPLAEVELAIVVDLRDLDPEADASEGARPELAALAAAEPWATLALVHDVLLAHAPVLRHRAALGLDAEPDAAAPRRDDQRAALRELLSRAHLLGRRLSLLLPPRREHDDPELGRRQAELARELHDLHDDRLALIDLDHPLFVDEQLDAQGRLDAEGRRLLALNVLHQLEVPLARRPFELEMVHVEGHDQTLVHRVERGFGEAGQLSTRFAAPDGIAVDGEGTRIVIADTGNHLLRQLRGNFHTVERLAGQPGEAGLVDGPREQARVLQPRAPELFDERVLFIDGDARERLRVVERDGWVHTLALTGARCTSMQRLRVHVATHSLFVPCSDGQLLRVDLASEQAGTLAAEQLSRGVVYTAIEARGDRLWLADVEGKIWERRIRGDGSLGRPRLVFANLARTREGNADQFMPHGRHVGFPYRFDEVALARVLDLRFVERYDTLLVVDEQPSAPGAPVPSERIQLRALDLVSQQVMPWIKSLAHGEANSLWNEQAQLTASTLHVGSMAIVERDASLVWLEHERSRLVRVGDGMFGLAQTANHHTGNVTIPHHTVISSNATRAANVQRPDRFLPRRWAPLRREGPFSMVVIASSLSSMSDRFANYSLARRLERELERELGYRDGIAVEVHALSIGAAKLDEQVRAFETWMQRYVPPDVVVIEAHDFGNAWLRNTKEPAAIAAELAKVEQLARRYDTLVIVYDNCHMEANRRDGLRASDPEVLAALDQARRLGFVVLRPNDLLLERLLLDAPWGNQPYGNNQHHGATWAIDRTAELLARLGYPVLRRFLRGRTPARLRERDPLEFELEASEPPLRSVLDGVEVNRKKLPTVERGHVQAEYADGRLRVHVDLSGFPKLARDEASLERLGLAVVLEQLDDELYATLVREIDVELVEFTNYDEYGEGVLDSARAVWTKRFDRATLGALVGKYEKR
jgi:hypothetical protein